MIVRANLGSDWITSAMLAWWVSASHITLWDWTSVESLSLFDARQSIPADSQRMRHGSSHEPKGSLFRNRKICWYYWALELKHRVAMGDSCKVFHITGTTCRNALTVNETISQADSSPIHDQQECLVWYTKLGSTIQLDLVAIPSHDHSNTSHGLFRNNHLLMRRSLRKSKH